MKNRLKMISVGLVVMATLYCASGADDKSELKDQKAKVAYAVGMRYGSNLKQGGGDLDTDIVAQAMKDVVAGRELKLTEQEARDVLTAYQKEFMARREEERKKMAEKNRKAGEVFLAENKGKPGVKTHTVKLPDSTTAEMQYKVITEGTGIIPKSNDMVTVNYRGTLIDGKEFDSSAKRGQPGKFNVNRVVAGWSEALQMMKVGSKWEIYLPSTLAYRDQGSRDIEPGATLIFEVELVGIDTPQPLTSDIIRVPSAEELKAGAKIEVLKPEDVEKAKAAAAATNKAGKKP